MTIIFRQLAGILAIAMLLVACEKAPDEEQIAQNIAAMKEAVERKNFTDIQGYLHDDFMANNRMDALEVKRLLQMYKLQHRKISVTIISSETSMDPAFHDRAQSTLSVLVTGSSGLLPSDGGVRKVTLSWVNESGDWLVLEANWQQHP